MKAGTLNVKAGTVVRNMRGSSQVFVWSFSRAGKTNTVNVEDVTVTNCQTYSSSNSETGRRCRFRHVRSERQQRSEPEEWHVHE